MTTNNQETIIEILFSITEHHWCDDEALYVLLEKLLSAWSRCLTHIKMIHWSQILQRWKCTSSELTCREWVCRSVCRPSALSTGSSAALLGPLASPSLTKICTNLLSDCLKMLKMFPHGSRRRASTPPPQQELGGPAGFYWAGSLAINLSLLVAACPARLREPGSRPLQHLPPPLEIRKPRLEAVARRGVTSLGGLTPAGGGRAGRRSLRMLSQHLTLSATQIEGGQKPTKHCTPTADSRNNSGQDFQVGTLF